MATVVIDAATRDKLLAAGGGAELLDESGTLVGRFIKLTRVGDYLIEGDLPSDEELERRERTGRRFSAAEVEARLQKLKEALEE